MNPFLLFIFGCLVVRSLFVYLAKTASKGYLQFYGYLAILPAIGFATIYLFGLRKTGDEAGGEIWWNDMRPIHALLYGLFAYKAIKGERDAWIVLAVDVLIGLAAFIYHYSSKGQNICSILQNN